MSPPGGQPRRAARPAFSGAVLTGGASRRMGRDKATAVRVEGEPLAARVARVLVAAGAVEVLAVGGRPGPLRSLGLDPRPDHHPGEGPLGGVATALAEAACDLVVVVACDLPDLPPALVQRLVTAAAGHDAAVARAPRLEPLVAAWWRSRALAHLVGSLGAGERAVHRALAGLDVVFVDVEAKAVRNVNTPADLAR